MRERKRFVLPLTKVQNQRVISVKVVVTHYGTTTYCGSRSPDFIKDCDYSIKLTFTFRIPQLQVSISLDS